MIQKDRWMDEITDKLKQEFGMRLLFAGLQGSYRRGEATEASDFDVVVVLDELTIKDLKEYRRLLKTMPEHEKACGFICGREELQNWPKHELFQFSQDTDSYYGSLDPLLPAWDETDILRSLKISAANLYHAACHLYLFGNPSTRTADLKSLYKAVFFPLQLAEYLRTGRYCKTKGELLQRLQGEEKALLEKSACWEQYSETIAANTEAAFEELTRWCGAILKRN